MQYYKKNLSIKIKAQVYIIEHMHPVKITYYM